MPRLLPEPPYLHGTPPRIGVLITNLGTPDAPSAPALRRYLRQFLSDPRVVEIPRLVWWPILNGIILNTRPWRSAQKYAKVWRSEGSPLMMHTERQAQLLAEAFADHPDIRIRCAMRYGRPSIAERLDQLKAENCTRILVLPLYPQFAASTTGSTYDAVFQHVTRWRNQPELRLVRSFHDDPGYVGALAQRIRQHWSQHGRGEMLVMSFHGVPQRALELGDPYFCECHKTGRLLGEVLGLPHEEYRITFQSRFGRAAWLEPYTQPTLEAMARDGLKQVDVICPGFVSDCLETLEEIAMENRDAFLRAGGQTFHYIPCLNTQPEWMDAMATLVARKIGDWLDPAQDAHDPAASRAHAHRLGAPR